MTIIVFLLDTSASMNQRVFLGGRPTLLDVAKSAVETFVKVRQRSIDSRQDRYMLLTFEDPPGNIKAGWKENLATFMSELKNLQANGLTTLGHALRHTFDVLNVNRMQHGIDTYGQGRCPFYLEPSIIVAITDGGKLSSNSGVQEELKMHGSSPGFELTREPFRWDQRLFSLVLRMSGQPAGDREIGLVPSDSSPIDAMCEVTGGRSYCITTHRMLHQCIDSLVQKVQAGVVIHFEKVGLDPPPLINNLEGKDEDDLDDKNDSKSAWMNCRKMIYVPRTNQKGFAGGFWPIPESFWPDTTMPTLPPRTAHPHVKFTCVAQEPLVVENFPFDKYELEPSPLTQYILARKQPTVCWQAYMSNSSNIGQLSQPFGYLKASTNLTCVNLFVMPHNYPILLPLLDDLFRVHRLKPSNEWKAQFGMYLSQMPGYYAGPLKRALIRMGAGNIAQTVPEETYLSYSVLNYLKKLKTQAKIEYEKTCNEVGARVKLSETKRIYTSYKNPFDVPRHQLLEHLAKLRTHFLRPTPFSDLQQDNHHSMPVGQMGNYQEYLKRQPMPLREIESTPVRQHMFGNPFKIDKRLMIDEADIDFLGQNGKSSKKEQQQQAQQQQALLLQQQQFQQSQMSPQPLLGRGMKRKPGPLPHDFNFTPKRSRSWSSGSQSPSMSPSYSPTPSPPLSPTRPVSPFMGTIPPPASPGLPTMEIVSEQPMIVSQPPWMDDDITILPSPPQPPPPAPPSPVKEIKKEEPPAALDKKPKEEPEVTKVVLAGSTTKAFEETNHLPSSFRAPTSFLSESMTRALWDDEDFQDRESDDDIKEELPDIPMEEDEKEEEDEEEEELPDIGDEACLTKSLIEEIQNRIKTESNGLPSPTATTTITTTPVVIPTPPPLPPPPTPPPQVPVVVTPPTPSPAPAPTPIIPIAATPVVSPISVPTSVIVPVNGEAFKENCFNSSSSQLPIIKEEVLPTIVTTLTPITVATAIPTTTTVKNETAVKTNGLSRPTTTTTLPSPPALSSPHKKNNHVTNNKSSTTNNISKGSNQSPSKAGKKKLSPVKNNNNNNNNNISNKPSKKTTSSPNKISSSSSSAPGSPLSSPSKLKKKVKKVPTTPPISNSPPPHAAAPKIVTLDEETVRRQNLELRTELFKEIRRPIFRMDLFLSRLTEISGSESNKIEFLKCLEKEAVRFKRKRVADILARQLLD